MEKWILSQIKEKVKESALTRMVESLKELGRQIKEMEWALNDLVMEIHIRENIQTEESKVKEFTNGPMETYIMVVGLMDPNKAMVFGKIQIKTITQDNGYIIWPTVMGFMSGLIMIVMLENGDIH